MRRVVLKKSIITMIVVACVLLLCSTAMATIAWMKMFTTTYKPKSDGAIKKAKCAVCHVKLNGGNLNSYGLLLKGKKIDAASLKAVESKRCRQRWR